MIDVGFWEVAMIGVMALIILGPERLPKVARTAGLWIGKARAMMREIKADVKSELDSADMGELKSIGDDLRDAGQAFKSQVEAADKSVQSETSNMDKAITDALNTPLSNVDNSAQDESSGDDDNKPAVDLKKIAKKKVTKKKTVRKKAGRKKVAKRKVSKVSSKAKARTTPDNKANA